MENQTRLPSPTPMSKRHRTEFTLVSSTRKKIRFCLEDDDFPLSRALYALGLIGNSVTAIFDTLEMSRLYMGTLHESKAPPPTLIQVVRHTLKDGTNYLKDLKKSIHNGGCVDLLDRTKCFLIDGHLNASYTKRGPGRHTTERFQFSDGKTTENSWRHFIAIRKGRIHSIGLPVNGIPVCNMWLDDAGRPDQEKGFMKRILRVYQVLENNEN